MNDIDQNTLDHHIGHTVVQAKAKLNNKMSHASLLLNDAIDALAINQPEIAAKRINAAIRTLKAKS